ncbi:amidohydrolase family protein [Micromonospora sp. NBC_01638]|uniref:amidohydrolase family protein n=1 Tax=Micromonospora sp. NBC_01638 TaxID=2975982 RepID=UPI003870E6FE|nr:amidohydrolase family protein [Micromonospora sp. NBC_01638]
MTGEQAPGRAGIVDAHHHLWVRARHPQPWIDPVTMAAIDADFEPADLAPLARAAGVSATVVVQSIASEAETVDLLTVAAEDTLVRGVVGWVDLTAADVANRIGRLRAARGGERLVGIRHLVQGETDPAYLDRSDVRRGIAAVGAAGLVFDLLVRQHQLAMAARLAHDLPEVSFVLDHLGKPALGRPEMAEWSRDLRALAESPNTTAKLSGLVTEVPRSHWTPGDLRPVVEEALDAFGPDRLMFGSDWPVCLLASSYLRWVEALAELLGDHDGADRAPVWGDTARRVYGLEAS